MTAERTDGAVTRTISSREKEGRAAHAIVASRTYDVTLADIWHVLTEPEQIPRWFLPISGELRRGGTYQLEGNAGGEIIRCDPPNSFELTWVMHGQVSWVNVTLAEQDRGGTQLRLEHLAHVPTDMWTQFGPGMVGIGWDQALFALGRLLTAESAYDPDEAVAWLSSDEGRAFVQKSSDAWCAASIEYGTDPDVARKAAERVRAAYSGE